MQYQLYLAKKKKIMEHPAAKRRIDLHSSVGPSSGVSISIRPAQLKLLEDQRKFYCPDGCFDGQRNRVHITDHDRGELKVPMETGPMAWDVTVFIVEDIYSV